mmetsp:Transcript_38641/g.28515  ORF Transcript_38641/g.28515 Transcript_38641/m.28515 type:complete len:207 (+) Transcript_38641:236-856(+)
MTGNDLLSLRLYNLPLPVSEDEEMFETAFIGVLASFIFAIAFLMTSKSVIESIINERDSSLKHQILVSGASLPSYWLAHYAGDVIFISLPCICAVISYTIFGIRIDGAWIFFSVFTFANPVFVYVFSNVFKEENTASIVIRIFYMIFGMICPVFVALIMLFESTFWLGSILRFMFMFVPIFSLNYGILIISFEDILDLFADAGYMQ